MQVVGCGSWVVVGVIQAPLGIPVLPPSWGSGSWVVGGRSGNTTIWVDFEYRRVAAQWS